MFGYVRTGCQQQVVSVAGRVAGTQEDGRRLAVGARQASAGGTVMLVGKSSARSAAWVGGPQVGQQLCSRLWQ